MPHCRGGGAWVEHPEMAALTPNARQATRLKFRIDRGGRSFIESLFPPDLLEKFSIGQLRLEKWPDKYLLRVQPLDEGLTVAPQAYSGGLLSEGLSVKAALLIK
jgi:hypothetical protein